MRSRIGGVCCVGLAAAALLGATAVGTAQDGKGEKIVYATMDMKAGKFRLWVVGVDGGEAKAITDDKEISFEAALSPDGKRVAFVVMADKEKQTADVVVMNLDGGGRKQLTKNG